MRLVIDLQGAQASNRNRGIGRYSLSLAQGLARNRGNHEVFIALNGLFPETIEPIRAAFDGLLPQENIRVWAAPGPVHSADPALDIRRRAAELMREQFLASLSPDLVLVSSLFEGLGDDAITSVGTLSGQIPTAVVLYDLIPLIHRDIYLKNPVVEQWYENKLDHLRRANLLLSISASSAKEAVDYLSFDSRQVSNISTAAEKHFAPAPATEEMRAILASRYGLNKPFVMYTGGIDHRKNIEGLIAAYARLPLGVRRKHQLAVVCSIQAEDRARLTQLALKEGLDEAELVLTGFVPEEDLLACYRSCKLFIFPSWHEGFGLPALEAMQCGRAVIAANTSSLPEVIGREDALFDPLDTNAITAKMAQVLKDDGFRAELERHGTQQARHFSWDISAARAWQALEASFGEVARQASVSVERPRMAFVSPLPPQASGISDYSAELLPELARHYRVEVVVAQDEVTDPYIRANCPIRSVEWFRQHAHEFDRVLYHFGNSDFHSHMFDLLHDHPGVVVLHDFFLSGIVAHRDVHGEAPGSWPKALLASHGWHAVRARFTAADTADVVWAYPANLEVLQNALGVIVHAEYSRQLAREWFGPTAADDWALIQHLRTPAMKVDRAAARRALGIPDDAFVVCSFGHIGPTKLNHRLLAAWSMTPLARDPHCRLVFVGQNHGGEYGIDLVSAMRGQTSGSGVEVTGYVDQDAFRQWLAAADVGVQLRTLSRGETSGTVLDCMNYGLATIVNANGSMKELDPFAVWMLPDDFEDHQLAEALTRLHADEHRRSDLATKGQQVIAELHAPRICADKYFAAIEGYYNRTAVSGTSGLLSALAAQSLVPPQSEWPTLAAAIAKNKRTSPRRRQLLLDVSELVKHDVKSGIQRVVRSVLSCTLQNPPSGWQVEPVYASTEDDGYRYARRFTCRFLGIPEDWAVDEPVEAYQGDIFLGLDLQPSVVPRQAAVLEEWHRRGVGVHFVVYDLVPVLMPDVFPDGAKAGHHRWLETVSRFDSAICISRAVADDLHTWLQLYGAKRERPFTLNWFHLGGDTHNSVPTAGLPADSEQVLAALSKRPSFLSVSTLEPRKGHGQILSAFDILWANGVDANLVFVGKQGWMVEDLIDRLNNHPEFGKRLFWLAGISDQYLDMIYAASTCLIAASEGEGFGLPLIEAAQHKCPIIARNIPVFREVAGEHAHYFANSKDPAVLAHAVDEWLALHRKRKAPVPDAMPWQMWAQSTDALLDCLMGKKPAYRQWVPDGALRFWGNDHRLNTQVGRRHRCRMESTRESGWLVFGPYLPLPAGRYSLIAFGGHKNVAGSEFIDLTSDGGRQTHSHAMLEPDGEGWRVNVQVDLPAPVSDFEVRLWVDACSELWLDGIELVPDAMNSLDHQKAPDLDSALSRKKAELQKTAKTKSHRSTRSAKNKKARGAAFTPKDRART